LDEKHHNGDPSKRDTPVLDREKSDSPLLASSGEIAACQIIEQRYKVLSLLGKGGMGFVYLVEEIPSGIRYALKTISAFEASSRALKRFYLEAQATNLLDQPNLIRLHDFGLINGQQPYFVMEYCQGRTLTEVIKAEGPLSEEHAIDIFIVICNALAYAHSQGVVHRDLKPSNIMITNAAPGVKANVKVLDFGIAKVFRDETAFNTLTRTGEIIGSPYYMSPEQCLGREVDSRSDIYSLGCVMFECLTGHPPFDSDNPLSTMLKHQSHQALSLKEATLGKEFSPDLERIIALMLEKDPANRYQDLLRVADNLRSVKKGEPIGSTQSKLKKKTFLREAIVAAALVGVAVGTCLIVPKLWQQPPAKVTHEMPVFLKQGLGLDLPSFETMRKQSKATNKRTSKFYCDRYVTQNQRGDFYFPSKPIGTCGFGDDERLFTAAVGKRTLRIPISFVLPMEPNVLSGFRNDQVRRLSMRGVMIDDSATDYIKDWSRLEYLDVGGSDVSDHSIANLKRLTKLTDLSVPETNISAAGLRQLPLEQLHGLNVNHILFVKEILPKLDRSKVLRVLQMVSTGLVDEDLKTIGRMPSLEFLDIRDNAISDKGIEQLRKLKALERLWVASTYVTPHCLDSIKQMPHLEMLSISMDKWPSEEKAKFVAVLKQRRVRVEDINLDTTK